MEDQEKYPYFAKDAQNPSRVFLISKVQNKVLVQELSCLIGISQYYTTDEAKYLRIPKGDIIILKT